MDSKVIKTETTSINYQPETAIPKLIFFDFLFMTGHIFSLPLFWQQVKKVSACGVLSYLFLLFILLVLLP